MWSVLNICKYKLSNVTSGLFPKSNHILEFFHKVFNTRSTPIGVKGGEWWVVTKWWAFLIQKFIIWPNAVNSGFFQPTYHKIHAQSHQPVLW